MGFPKDFVFGAATAAFQVEGATKEGGRTPSIWDGEHLIPGRVTNGDSADVACDHYHRYPEDVRLMKELGLDSYRFSISWPRIFPQKGKYNEEGMQFYKNLLAELKKSGISAAVTVYHWDLPQWAQDEGGWLNRECVNWYLEFAAKCFEELDGDVALWITHNEPFCASFLAYQTGDGAPGIATTEKGLRAAHHILLSHGMAVRAYRKMGGKKKIGITLNLGVHYPEKDTFADRFAVRIADGYGNRWFLEPVFHGRYPDDLTALFAARCGTDFDFIREGDLDCISAPIDFLGVNYYSSTVVRYRGSAAYLTANGYSGREKTAMGWDITPDSLVELIAGVRRDYTDIPVYITENGSAWHDEVTGGKVHDEKRCDYLLRHLDAVSRANDRGLNVAGYFAWSLMDNLEWNQGYSQRFGIIYIDFNTLERIPKDSFHTYRKCIAEAKKTGKIRIE
jgi:beta-glucosidase